MTPELVYNTLIDRLSGHYQRFESKILTVYKDFVSGVGTRLIKVGSRFPMVPHFLNPSRFSVPPGSPILELRPVPGSPWFPNFPT